MFGKRCLGRSCHLLRISIRGACSTARNLPFAGSLSSHLGMATLRPFGGTRGYPISGAGYRRPMAGTVREIVPTVE